MSDQRDGGIAWTDETWNCVRGCSRVSEGCRHCYAESMAKRFCGPGMPYEGLATAKGWTREVRLVPEHLADPLRWRRPRRVFVNSMSDLFHEALSNEQIAAVFGVMAAASQHTFQVLTKRPARMRAWFAWLEGAADRAAGMFTGDDREWCRVHMLRAAAMRRGVSMPNYTLLIGAGWPLPNVHLGVSVEDQTAADERIPLLLETPAAVRFISVEPMLGPIDFRRVPGFNRIGLDLSHWWIIVGGESGPGARPCDIAWIRSIVAQCKAAGVRVFVKQLGAYPVDNDSPSTVTIGHDRIHMTRESKGGDPSEWPVDLRVREFPR